MPPVLFASQLDQFCDRLKAQNKAGQCAPLVIPLDCPAQARSGKSSDLYLGFQCFSADTIANFCFATSFNQLSFPDFRGDVVTGVDIAMDTLTLRKFSEVVIVLVRYFPRFLLARISPALKGLITCQEVSQQRHPFLLVHVV
jgi:hypothetical protein